MRGVFPSKEDYDRINKKYQTEESRSLALNILQQDKEIIYYSNEHFNKFQKINEALNEQLFYFSSNVGIIAESIKPLKPEPMFVGLDAKCAEFKRVTEQNNAIIKKHLDNIPDIQRKKKENDDFFKKFIGEKKVWLARLKEKELRDDAYSKGFKYLYEAKTIKLMLEGILLEKVQDAIDKRLYEVGRVYGWDIMDEETLLEKRKKQEFKLNTRLVEMTNEEEAKRIESEKKVKWESKDRKRALERESIMEIWKRIWAEIWLPGTILSTDPDFVAKRELVKKVTMEVTFEIFKTTCFDVWKLKNMMNSAEEYVVMDKMRKYFPEETTERFNNRDESILNMMMDMIEGIKQEEEIIYCNLEPAKIKIKEYSKQTEHDSAAIDRLNLIIEKISQVQKLLKTNSTALIRDRIEEIKQLIKSIPDDKEKKLFADSLKNKTRLYDCYLPLTTFLMVVLFVSVGKKRNKGYDDKIEELNKEISNLKLINIEIAGKWTLLTEVKSKLTEGNMKDVLIDNQEDIDIEYQKNIENVHEARMCINKIIQIKNQIEKNQFDYYKKITKKVIKPKEL